MYKLGKTICSKDEFGWYQNIYFNNCYDVEKFLESSDCNKLIYEFSICIGNKTLFFTRDIDIFTNELGKLTNCSFDVYKGLYQNAYDDNRITDKEYETFIVYLK